MCADLARFSPLQEPENYPVFNAVQNLAAAAQSLGETLGGGDPGAELHTFVTPTVMSVQSISMAIFGNASRAMDVLNLNPIEDASAVPANFTIRYYP
jgi:hypothetical protein